MRLDAYVRVTRRPPLRYSRQPAYVAHVHEVKPAGTGYAHTRVGTFYGRAEIDARGAAEDFASRFYRLIPDPLAPADEHAWQA